MTVNRIQRLGAALLLVVITMHLAHAQSFPWRVQTRQDATPGGTISFTKIDAPDTTHAMALGFGGSNIVVCRTTDGGATWDQPLQRLFLETAMHDLSHPTPDVAVIVGDTMYRDTGNTIMYTHDGGNSWRQGWCDSCRLADGSRYHLWNVSMCDSLNGILSAFLSCLARTTDGGATWHRIPDPTNGKELFYGLQCLNPSTYVISSAVFQSLITSIYRTTDSGKTWTHSFVARGAGVSDFIDPLHAWSVGYGFVDSTLYNVVARTTDAGASWDTVFDAPVLSRRYDLGVRYLSMADATHGIASGNGGTWLYTTNGATWQEGPNLDSIFHVFNITSVSYPHPDKAWATDVSGRILVYEPRTTAVPIVPGVAMLAAISACPNPIIGDSPVRLSITLPHSALAEISLLDIWGSVVASTDQWIGDPGTYHLTWTLPVALPSGTYFLRLNSGAIIATTPISIMH